MAEGDVIWRDLLECLLDYGNSESIVLNLHPERSTPIDVPDIIFDQDQYSRRFSGPSPTASGNLSGGGRRSCSTST